MTEAISNSPVVNRDEIVPRFCNHVQLAVLNHRNVVLSFLYSEEAPSAGTLIEKIVLDLQNAEALAHVMTEAVTKAKKSIPHAVPPVSVEDLL